MKKACLLLLLLATPAMAENVPDEIKKQALMQAYQLNGNSMVGWGSIDLSDCYKKTATGQPIFDCPKAVKLEKVAPTAKENFENRVLVPPPNKKRHGP